MGRNATPADVVPAMAFLLSDEAGFITGVTLPVTEVRPLSDTTFRLARLGEDAAIIDFINANFDMRLPLLNRPELYHHYYPGRGGVPQFAANRTATSSAAGYILANTKRRPDIWVSVWVAAKATTAWG